MKNSTRYAAAIFAVCLVFAVGVTSFGGTERLTELIEYVINASSNDDAFKIELTTLSNLTSSSAKTDTVQEVLGLTHETSGVPANGIGAGIVYTQETSAANNEDVMAVNAVMTDVTAASEDAKFSVELMAAGAAKSEVFSVTSTGVVTLVNDETIDNTVDGTVTYTATTHALVGAATLSGDLDVDTDVLSVSAAADTVSTSGSLSVDEGTTFSSWVDTPVFSVAASSYTLDSTSKAYIVAVDYTTTGTVDLFLDSDLLVDGRALTFYDEDANANANNIVIRTEGAETISGAATYTMDADSEAVSIASDGTNWFVTGVFP